MGNWQLEVAKMALYVFFPVASFYAYHQVDYFEDILRQFERKRVTKTTLENDRLIQEGFEKIRLKDKERHEELLKQYQMQQQSK